MPCSSAAKSRIAAPTSLAPTPPPGRSPSSDLWAPTPAPPFPPSTSSSASNCTSATASMAPRPTRLPPSPAPPSSSPSTGARIRVGRVSDPPSNRRTAGHRPALLRTFDRSGVANSLVRLESWPARNARLPPLSVSRQIPPRLRGDSRGRRRARLRGRPALPARRRAQPVPPPARPAAHGVDRDRTHGPRPHPARAARRLLRRAAARTGTGGASFRPDLEERGPARRGLRRRGRRVALRFSSLPLQARPGRRKISPSQPEGQGSAGRCVQLRGLLSLHGPQRGVARRSERPARRAAARRSLPAKLRRSGLRRLRRGLLAALPHWPGEFPLRRPLHALSAHDPQPADRP